MRRVRPCAGQQLKLFHYLLEHPLVSQDLTTGPIYVSVCYANYKRIIEEHVMFSKRLPKFLIASMVAIGATLAIPAAKAEITIRIFHSNEKIPESDGGQEAVGNAPLRIPLRCANG
jgi:hypothetical protein